MHTECIKLTLQSMTFLWRMPGFLGMRAQSRRRNGARSGLRRMCAKTAPPTPLRRAAAIGRRRRDRRDARVARSDANASFSALRPATEMGKSAPPAPSNPPVRALRRLHRPTRDAQALNPAAQGKRRAALFYISGASSSYRSSFTPPSRSIWRAKSSG